MSVDISTTNYDRIMLKLLKYIAYRYCNTLWYQNISTSRRGTCFVRLSYRYNLQHPVVKAKWEIHSMVKCANFRKFCDSSMKLDLLAEDMTDETHDVRFLVLFCENCSRT